jgi:hypothetical protein
MHGRDRGYIFDSCDDISGKFDAGKNALDGLDKEPVAIESGCDSAEDVGPADHG